MPYELPQLPYPYDALEPWIDVKTMEIHHGKHHKGYVDNLNKALDAHPKLHEKPIEKLLGDLDAVPEDIRTAVRNHGGGHHNHSLFWKFMKKDGGGEPQGNIAEALAVSFQSFGAFKEQFTNAAIKHFGSGWAWLVQDGSGKLFVESLQNQDSPFMRGWTPILGLDIWEHAYYLKYQNRRVDYVAAFWNVVNWEEVEQIFVAGRR